MSTDGLHVFALDPTSGFVRATRQIAELLGCRPGLVDVLARTPDYVVYSVFDCDAGVNETAMKAVAELTGISFDPANDDEVLCGSVLVVTA